jgi:hypothetical protein
VQSAISPGITRPYRAISRGGRTRDGCAEAALLADGFSIDQLAGLVIQGYAVMQRRRVDISGRMRTVVWMRITEAGRKACFVCASGHVVTARLLVTRLQLRQRGLHSVAVELGIRQRRARIVGIDHCGVKRSRARLRNFLVGACRSCLATPSFSTFATESATSGLSRCKKDCETFRLARHAVPTGIGCPKWHQGKTDETA